MAGLVSPGDWRRIRGYVRCLVCVQTHGEVEQRRSQYGSRRKRDLSHGVGLVLSYDLMSIIVCFDRRCLDLVCGGGLRGGHMLRNDGKKQDDAWTWLSPWYLCLVFGRGARDFRSSSSHGGEEGEDWFYISVKQSMVVGLFLLELKKKAPGWNWYGSSRTGYGSESFEPSRDIGLDIK